MVSRCVIHLLLLPPYYISIQGIHRGSYHGFNLVAADLKTGEMAYGANPLPRRTSRTTAEVVQGSTSKGSLQDPDLDLVWDGPIILNSGQIYGE